uniref:Uncharacterized protein n=1 Tax=Solanum lycopersicum TaxID=4081 RepID=A0A3Q7FGE2_SOLLC
MSRRVRIPKKKKDGLSHVQEIYEYRSTLLLESRDRSFTQEESENREIFFLHVPQVVMMELIRRVMRMIRVIRRVSVITNSCIGVTF